MLAVENVAIQQVRDTSDGLLAFAHVTLTHGIRIYKFRVFRSETPEGEPTVLIRMPTHYRTFSCAECGTQNKSGARFCNHCSGPLPPPAPDLRPSMTTVQLPEELRDAVYDAIYEAAHDRLVAPRPALATQAS